MYHTSLLLSAFSTIYRASSTHWGRGPLEVGGNMSGTLKGQEPFTCHYHNSRPFSPFHDEVILPTHAHSLICFISLFFLHSFHNYTIQDEDKHMVIHSTRTRCTCHAPDIFHFSFPLPLFISSLKDNMKRKPLCY